MLTKSNYLNFIQCKRYLWLSKKRKDLAGEVSTQQQAVFDQGYLVESYAQKLFSGGVITTDDIFKAAKETKELVKNGTTTIFQATAIAGELLIRADIFQFNSATDSWDIYEVKSSTELKRDVHLPDICFQKIVFERASYKIGKTYLILVNNKYVRHGEINPSELLTILDVTPEVEELRGVVEADILIALDVLKGVEEPQVRIVKQCEKPYTCPFIDHCWIDIPEYSVYNVKQIAELKLQGLLVMGIMEIQNIPDDYPLSDTQKNQVVVAKSQKPMIDKEIITSTLAGIAYPIYFLDYETFSSAIPLFDGTSPYQQVCFQYSCHVLPSEGADLEHYEYLASGQENPISALAERLKNVINTDAGTVIVWNKSFEMSRNDEIGKMYPEHKAFMGSVNRRVFDLMEIFSKQYYVHPNFYGSHSIKNVLPVLVPELSYKSLGIQEGGAASLSWYQMNFGNIDESGSKKIYNDLLEYCGLDSLAMVRIYQELRSIGV